MRGLSREVLARDAAARLDGAACKECGPLWTEQEARHAAAGSQQQARRAAAPLLEICAGCPVAAGCRAWAQIDRYTGIAAGSAWVNGAEKPAHWVRRGLTRLAS